MKKIKNTKGFTLMEMLIVVAIIAILIAIAIPTFTAQLEKARQAADIANIRSAYSEAMVKYLNGEKPYTSTVKSATAHTKDWADGLWPEYLNGGTAVPFEAGSYPMVTIKDDGTNTVSAGDAPSTAPSTNPSTPSNPG